MECGAPRVLVADDDQDMCDILSGCLTYDGFEVLIAGDGETAWTLAQSGEVAIALLDVVMSGLSGLELLDRLKTLDPAPEIVLITAYATVAQAVEAMKRGATDYLTKPICINQMRQVVGKAWAARQARLEEAKVLCALTPRERQVLGLLAEGKKDSEIADVLGVSARTISNHVSNILSKMGVESRVQAAIKWHHCPSVAPK